jgi:hypothetical protein
MIHREALSAKTLPMPLKEVLQQSVKILNYIKNSSLNTRLFRRLCEDMEAEHVNLLYHTEVRWLSRGNVLLRLYELRNEVFEFLQSQKKLDIAAHLQDSIWLAKLAYLTDIFERLNSLNVSLQGKNVTIMDFHDKLHGFVATLEKKYTLFPRLQKVSEEKQGIEVEDIETHLRSLKCEFERYFPDVDPSKFDMIRNPFEFSVSATDEEAGIGTGIDDHEEEELVKLKNDTESRRLFKNKSHVQFWCLTRTEYPRIADRAIKMIMPFPSTYVCESSFSTMSVMKTKARNRLDISSDMRVALTSVEPDMNQLARRKQGQSSH